MKTMRLIAVQFCALVLLGMCLAGGPAMAAQLSETFDNPANDNALPASLVKNSLATATEVYQDGTSHSLIIKSPVGRADWTQGINGVMNPINFVDTNRANGANIEIVVNKIDVTSNVGGRDVGLEIFLLDPAIDNNQIAYAPVSPKVVWIFDVDGNNNITELEAFTGTAGGFGPPWYWGDRRFAPGQITFPLTINIAINQYYTVVSLNGKPYMTNSNVNAASFINGAVLHTTLEATGGAATAEIKSIKVSDLGTPLLNLPPVPTKAGFGTDFDNAAFDGQWDPAQFYLGGTDEWGTTAAHSCAQAGGKMVLNPTTFTNTDTHEGVSLLGTMDLPVGPTDALWVRYQIDSIEQVTDPTKNGECMTVISEGLSNFGYFHNQSPSLSIGIIRQGATNDVKLYSRSKPAIADVNKGTNGYGFAADGSYNATKSVTFPLLVEAHVRAQDFDLFLNGEKVIDAQPHVANFSSGRLAAQVAAANADNPTKPIVTLNHFNIGVNDAPWVPVELSSFAAE